MDTKTPDAKLPAGVLAGPPAAGVPPSTAPIEPLDLIEGPKVRTKLRLYAILSALYLALFVAALDQTIISIAIPTITSDLHSAQGYVWIGGAYLLANAATGPIWSKCSDIWGRKPLLLAAVALFTGASLLAALSNSMAIDWIGTLSILAVTLMLLLGLDFGGAIFPWNSPKVICLIVFGGLMIGFFLFSEQRLAKYPIIPLTVFRNGSNNATFLVAFAHGMVLIGIEYYLPLFLQSVLQASPLRSGILMLPLIGTQAIVEILAGVVIHRTGRYQELIWVGAVLMTVGTGLYITFGPDTSIAMVVGLEILGAFGPALLFQGPMVSIQNTVTQEETASATACLGFIRNLAMSLSVVLGGVVFQNSMEARQLSLTAAGLDASVREALSGSQAAANVGITQTIQDVFQRHVVLEAFSWSMRNMFIMYTCLSGVALAASAFIRHRDLNEEHTETKTGIQSLAKAG
ncbi:hypothetical protein PG990_013994 [Apiospora arundinis]